MNRDDLLRLQRGQRIRITVDAEVEDRDERRNPTFGASLHLRLNSSADVSSGYAWVGDNQIVSIEPAPKTLPADWRWGRIGPEDVAILRLPKGDRDLVTVHPGGCVQFAEGGCALNSTRMGELDAVRSILRDDT